VWINLVAAKHTLNRGKVLNKQDLEYKSVDLGKHRHQGETGIDQLVGLTVKREIDKGTVISTRYLEKQYLINKNEHISLQINTATFSANVKAIALEDGQLGEVINVKNLSSKKVVQGRVIAQGVAEATF
jgi:flagella basal body P-ring formation protein FlgA